MRAVTGRPVKIRFRIEDEGGVLTDVDPSTTVSVVVTDGAGVQLATGSAVSEATGLYAYTLAAQTTLDVLTATATATVDGATVTLSETVRLVDRRMAALSVLRQSSELADLSVPDFLRAVDEAEDWLTSALNFSPVLTGDRTEQRLSAASASLSLPKIFYPQSIYALSFNGNPYTPDQLITMRFRSHALEYEQAYYTGGYDPIIGTYGPSWIPGVYEAHVSHGMTDTPNDLSRAMRKLAEHVAKTTTYPDRATRVMTEASEIWFSTPDGEKRLTGLPEVDGIILRYRLELPFSEDSGAF